MSRPIQKFKGEMPTRWHWTEKNMKGRSKQELMLPVRCRLSPSTSPWTNPRLTWSLHPLTMPCTILVLIYHIFVMPHVIINIHYLNFLFHSVLTWSESHPMFRSLVLTSLSGTVWGLPSHTGNSIWHGSVSIPQCRREGNQVIDAFTHSGKPYKHRKMSSD